MPKRTWRGSLDETEIEAHANKSDSNDGDYDERVAHASVKRSGRTKNQKGSRGKRRKMNSDDEDNDLDDSDIIDDSFVEDTPEPEPLDVDPKTGRPRRSAAKKKVNYDVDSSSEESPPPSENEDEVVEEVPRKKRKLVIKLQVPPRASRAASVARSRQGLSVEPQSAGTRRSTRHRSEQGGEELIALTDSGRHAQVVRPPTHSPEGRSSRVTTGRKGLKKPSTRILTEEAEEGGEEEEEAVAEEQAVTDVPTDKEDPPMDEPFIEEIVTVQTTIISDTQMATQGDDDTAGGDKAEVGAGQGEAQINVEEGEEEEEEEEEEDEDPISRGRSARTSRSAAKTRSAASAKGKKHSNGESSDFEPGAEGGEDEDISDSEASQSSPRKGAANTDDEDESGSGPNRSRGRGRTTSRRRAPDHEDNIDEREELLDEIVDLQPSGRRRKSAGLDDVRRTRDRRATKPVDYAVYKNFAPVEDAEPITSPPRRTRGGAGAWERNLYPVNGPFGGAGGLGSIFGGPGAIGAAGGVDSDSSDDERAQRPAATTIGMTPTTATAPGLLPPPQTHGADPLQASGLAGTPANLGKIKDRQSLADADPLGVDPNVNFDSVGGLQGHIDQLKEMVSLPLLYPEIFSRFHVTPPRGVLFHGPPGTGKTLLARALASSVGSQGRKVTFYMRKGADALSKWVGEAERQLRLLFEEARKTQPSIIFFDEIDGLAPVRSSKQEQIHASIVSTLLALMDGMDGRGQVIVIGATNRPDSIDPALRRPGRFDREFYFPLPNTEARRAILDIHTNGWVPGLPNAFKDQVAELTKGYGGADLRALCTEAALNAVQRTYPQIYTSNEKLIIDPKKIDVTAKDFMISIKKLVPSSERSASSGAAPLPSHIEPLLRKPLVEVKNLLEKIIPHKKQLTALQEARFEDYSDTDGGFQREKFQEDFETSRIFRPRLLIEGSTGMGQNYLGSALLNYFEGLHVQTFDLPTLLGDSTRSAEATIISFFSEVRRHKPGVIFLPDVEAWMQVLPGVALSTFLGLLRKIPATDPVLVLGLLEGDLDLESEEHSYLNEIFGYSRKNQYRIPRPDEASRIAYFHALITHIRRHPREFPMDPENRKKRKLEVLQVAPPPPPREQTKEELKLQKKKDRQFLNYLKIRIQPIMDQIKLKYKKFRSPPIPFTAYQYLVDEENSTLINSATRNQDRPYERATDKDGNPGLRETNTGTFWYNMDTVCIEDRLTNGYYCRPKDFLQDVKFLAKDSKTLQDRDKIIKSSELAANVEVDIGIIEAEPMFADAESVYLREMKRRKDSDEKARKRVLEQRDEVAKALREAGSEHAAEVAAANATRSSNTQAYPPTLAQPAPPLTPSRPSQNSSLSNGNGSMVVEMGSRPSLSNGSPAPSREGDVQMSGVEPSQSQPAESSWGGPPRGTPGLSSAPRSQQANTQKSAFTSMPAGSQIEDFTNDASTTTSGKKTTENSNRSSDPWTSGSNGIIPRKDEEGVMRNEAPESQMPDTQEVPSSQGSGPHSQPLAINNLLNSHSTTTPTPTPHRPLGPPPPPSQLQQSPDSYVINAGVEDEFHKLLVRRTSGLSVEQLEQVHSALMDAVWRHRQEYNRVKVQKIVEDAFNEVMPDLLAKGVGASSSE